MDKDMVKTTVKEKRMKKNVTIAEVAKVVGKNPTFVAAALNGNHRFTTDEAKKVGALLDPPASTVRRQTTRPRRYSRGRRRPGCTRIRPSSPPPHAA